MSRIGNLGISNSNPNSDLSTNTVVIKSGDTLGKIADRFNISLPDLLNAIPRLKTLIVFLPDKRYVFPLNRSQPLPIHQPTIPLHKHLLVGRMKVFLM